MYVHRCHATLVNSIYLLFLAHLLKCFQFASERLFIYVHDLVTNILLIMQINDFILLTILQPPSLKKTIEKENEMCYDVIFLTSPKR